MRCFVQVKANLLLVWRQLSGCKSYPWGCMVVLLPEGGVLQHADEDILGS